MRVTVVLLGMLRSAAGTDRVELHLSEGSNVKDALVSLDVEEVAYGATVLNAEQAFEDDSLRDGDVLYVFPPASGG